jgi:hypothetical protein
MGVALIRAEGRTDMTKLIGAFRDYANAPKNVSDYSVTQPISVTNGFRMQVCRQSPLQQPARSPLECDTVYCDGYATIYQSRRCPPKTPQCARLVGL